VEKALFERAALARREDLAAANRRAMVVVMLFDNNKEEEEEETYETRKVQGKKCGRLVVAFARSG
jgi:hypothetical protein